MDLKTANSIRWDACHIPADKASQFKHVADVLTENQVHYQAVEKLTGVPWWFIAVAHYREAGFTKAGQPRWDCYLGNGQPLNKKTTLVPAGRGPFKTWEDGAVDALKFAPPFAARNTDWSIGGSLSMLEKYNGLGYFDMGKPSPYIWAGTDQYSKGKYIADGKYDPNAVDQQLGCAGILKFMGAFKTAPVGAGTLTGAVVAGGATAAAASHPTIYTWMEQHWGALLVTVIGVGILVDIAMTIYNNNKNKLKVSNVNTSPMVG